MLIPNVDRYQSLDQIKQKAGYSVKPVETALRDQRITPAFVMWNLIFTMKQEVPKFPCDLRGCNEIFFGIQALNLFKTRVEPSSLVTLPRR